MKTFTLLCLFASAIAAPAPQASGTTNCAAIQMKLEQGIQANLDIQAQELKGYAYSPSAQNSTILTGTPLSVYALKLQGGTAGFNATQTSVLAIQQRGVDIRANNQKLAKEINSPAADGLAIVAGAQTKEIDQVKSLKGNAAADGETIKMLVQEVMDGTMQNQKNLQAAKGQVCAK
ncbi:hypothetical protein AG0111_0g8862 [Alternaria gaisen]|uniref:Uncharacterized protein n=1 Tax=Alternaria gaisen TaxID=167740 RepID=A0ACB6FF94_9PLEO|nr:hypothetical protein AG0111_0g8862 [Alternaria gaisen]